MVVQAVEIPTLADLKYHLHDTGIELGRLPERQVTNAMLSALRDIVAYHPWQYYRRRRQIVTTEPYSTGTVSYNSSTNVLTLTGGTWPSWAKYGVVQIGSRKFYSVGRILSTTTLSFNENTLPSGDLTDETYSLMQEVHPLPPNIKSISELIDLGTRQVVSWATPTELLAYRAGQAASARPQLFTTLGDARYPSGLCLQFSAYANSERTYDAIYEAAPYQVSVVEIEDTASISTGTNDVTGTDSVFTDDMVGSVIRFATNTTKPTNAVGYVDSAAGEIVNRYTWQSIVQSVSSATALKTVDNAPETLSGKAIVISDPVDVRTGPMRECLYRLAEWKLSQIARQDSKLQAQAESSFRKSLRLAIGADKAPLGYDQRYGDREGWTLADWAGPTN